MKAIIYILTFLLATEIFAQTKKAEDYGFRYLQTIFKGDKVDILIKSKKGDEQKKKPIFLFCQGSLPQPLIKFDEQGPYSVLPFKTDSLEIDFHIVIIGKPYIPLIADAKTLGRNMCFEDSLTHKAPKKYSNRNYLDYYVDRNLKVIDFLQKQPFISNKKLVVAGHSEGSTIASKFATKTNKITHLIYASGNPLGRILSIIQQDRGTETDGTGNTENEFEYWEQVVKRKTELDDTNGDTPKATYDFSIPPIQYLQKLTIPILVCYGTKDFSSPYNDYLRVEMIRLQKKNFTFKSYIGLEHNFFPLTENGQPDYDKYNWDKIANEWWKWTTSKQ
nr:acyl-CoA thioester hydrolase/BAAT C-terminal domain-containing protein [uncultured Flavobacterium sp.]